MAMTWKNQYDTLPEELIDLQTLDDVAQLQRELVELTDLGHAAAARVPMWVIDRAAGRDDGVTAPTRSRYRKALALVLEHRPDGPGRLNGRLRSENGSARLGVMVGIGSAGAAVLAGAYDAIGALTPIIHVL